MGDPIGSEQSLSWSRRKQDTLGSLSSKRKLLANGPAAGEAHLLGYSKSVANDTRARAISRPP